MNNEVNKTNLDCLSGYKDTEHCEDDICYCCKKPFKRYWGELKYQIKHKGRIYDFCSYTCRNKVRNKLKKQKEEKFNFQATTMKCRLQEYVNAEMSNEQIAFELNTYANKVKLLLDEYGIEKGKK